MAATETTKDSISSDDIVEPAVRKRDRSLPPGQKAPANAGSLAVNCYSAYCKSKCEEWTLKGAYPLIEKVAQLMANPTFCLAAWPPTKNYYCFAASSQSQQQHHQHQQHHHQQSHHLITNHLTETLHHLGWTAIDARDTRAFDRLQLAADSLLLVGPEVGAALRQRADSSRFACSLAFWEQRLPCLETYWQLHEALESFELSLVNYSRMGLLNNPERRRYSCRDFLLPSVHLGEVWGRRLSRFLKAHGRYRLTRATPVAAGKPGSGGASAASSSPASGVVAELAFSPPGSGDKSGGRRRLSQLEEMKDSGQLRNLLCLSGASWFSLALQAYPETQMLVIGRRFALETFLLLAPRRNPVEFGFAAFFHPGLVRVRASLAAADQAGGKKHHHHDHDHQQQQQHLLSQEQDEEQTQQQHQQMKVIEPCRDQATFTWLPEQLSDYLSAVKPSSTAEAKDWLSRSAYPQIRAACAYLATALAQYVTDSAYTRYHLLRLSFVVGVSSKKDGKERRRIHLDDISQRLAPQQSASTPSTAIDYCESLVLPRLMQESALILSELLVRSAHIGDLPARELASPQNMRLIYDSVDPSVQRDILAYDWNSC